MTVPAALPKAGSGALKALWVDVKAALDLPRLIVTLEGALDRKTLEVLLQKLSHAAPARSGQLERAELVGRLAAAFHASADAAYAQMRELDRAAAKERHIVASIEEDAIGARLETYRALDFRRERSRLVWALLRDGRSAHRVAAVRILDGTFEQLSKLREVEIPRQLPAESEAGRRAEHRVAEEVAAGTAGQGPEPLVQALREQLAAHQQAIADQERAIRREGARSENALRERSELLARLGQRERALRDEVALRQALEAEIVRLKRDVDAAQSKKSADATEATLIEENARLRDKLRTLERKLAHAVGADNAEAAQSAAEERAVLIASAAEAERVAAAARAALDDARKREDKREARVEELRAELKDARRQLAERASTRVPRTEGARVGVFVDAANLSASARRDFGSKLDYRALLQAVLDEREKAVAVAFVVRDGDERVYQGFATSLRDAGYELREKRPKVRADGTRKADWDMGIAMEILDRVEDIDVVVLCTGDGDFVPLVKRLKREGLRVECAAFRASSDDALLRAVDAFLPLDGRFRMLA